MRNSDVGILSFLLVRTPLIGRVDHAVIVVMHRWIWRPGPCRERNRFTTASSNRESEDEDDDLGATVHSRRHDVIVCTLMLAGMNCTGCVSDLNIHLTKNAGLYLRR